MERSNQNQPPTDDCMKKFQTMQRLEVQRSEFIAKRSEEILEKKNRPRIMPLRKKPPPRYNEYEDDKTGLKKCYGKYAPFFDYPKPANMRHYENMKVKKSESFANAMTKI